MATLHSVSLPVEVRTTIIDYTLHEDFDSFTPVCRTFQRVAQPRLYGKIDLEMEGKDRFLSFQLNNLFRTVLSSPYLASLIQAVRIGRSLPCEYWINFPPLTAFELKLARDSVYVMQIPSAYVWIRRLESGGVKGGLNVALACPFYSLPNLEALELNTPFKFRTAVSTNMLQSVLHSHLISPSPPTFGALKCIDLFTYFHPSREELRGGFCDFLCQLYLPSIETIKAVVLEPLPQFVGPTNTPSASIPIHLHLYRVM